MSRSSLLRAALVALAIALTAPAAAPAAPALDGEFSVTGQPRHLALGPDGNVWFTQLPEPAPMDYSFGKIEPNGAVTEYKSPNANPNPNGIAAGPDGRIWIVEAGRVLRVDTANPTAPQSFDISGLNQPRGITAGPDGNLWAASDDKVLKIDTNGLLLNSYDVPGMSARGITAGGDGNLWIADFGSGRIVKVTTAGVATPHVVGGGPQDVAAGPAGQLAFSNPGANPHVVGRMAYDGTFQTTPMPLTDPFGVTFGTDGAYWTAQFAADALGRVSPAGDYSQLKLTAGSGPRYVTAGAGDTLWVSLQTTNKIARVTGVLAPVTPPVTPVTPDVTPPMLSRLRLVPSTFRVGRGATTVLARARAGTRIRFTLSEAARVTLRMERATPGRVSRRRCVRPIRILSRAKRCTRWVHAGTLTRDAKAGARSIAFSGRVGKRALRPGRYRVVAVAADAVRNRGARRSARFRVVKR